MIRCKLGDLEFTVVTNESANYSNEITDRQVEDIGSVADHVSSKPSVFSLSGVITGPDAGQKISTLRIYTVNRELLKYVGRNTVDNVIIESLSSVHEIANGFTFDITLKRIRIAQSQTVQIQAPIVARQAKKVTNKGTQPVREKAADESKLNAIRAQYSGIEYGRLLK